MDIRVLAIAVVVLIATIDSGEAVWCYICNTGEHYEGARCDSETLNKNDKKDKYQTDLLFNCDDEGLKDNKTYTMCRKFMQDVEGDYRVVRTCATGGRPDDGCIPRVGTKGIKLWYCECRGDACNSALPSVTPVSSLLLTLVIAVLTAVWLP